jgi:hypothetical protein
MNLTSKYGKRLAGFAMFMAVLTLSFPLAAIGNASPAFNMNAFLEQSNFRFILSTPVTLGDFTDQDRDFGFHAPDVNRARDAVLMLRVRGVQCPNNTIRINGVVISDTLVVRDADELDDFHTEYGRVPANTLNAVGNTLSVSSGFCVAPDRDEFTIDNVVIFYHQP